MILDAKTHYLKIADEVSRTQLINLLGQSLVKTAMTFSLAQLAESGATAEQINGAIKFREILLSIAEPKPEPPTFPEKKLAGG